MEILFWVGPALALLLMFAFMWHLNVRWFRLKIKTGDICAFYFYGDRYIGEVISRPEPDKVLIKNAYGKFIRPIDEIYPA